MHCECESSHPSVATTCLPVETASRQSVLTSQTSRCNVLSPVSSIVLLADSYAPQESDARMLRTLLCLMQLDKSQQLAGRNGLMVR